MKSLEVAIACFKLLSLHLPGGHVKHRKPHEYLSSGQDSNL